MSSFVGRAEELAVIRDALDRAGQGHPHLVLVGGEAGVGKSSLVAEAVAGRVRTIVGRCVPLTGGSLPYGPWLEVLRELGQARLPEPVRRLLLGSDSASSTVAVGGGRELAQAAVLDAIQQVLALAAAAEPLAVVIEDLHWADQSTLDALAFIARRRRNERLVVVVTYRTDEPESSTWRKTVAELARVQPVHNIDLAPFDRGELADLLEGLGRPRGAPPLSADLVDRVLVATGGNAFLAAELASVLAANEDFVMPAHLRELLLTRLESLSAGALSLVRLVAVCARPVPDSLFELLPVAEGADVGADLRAALAAGVLVRDRRTDLIGLCHGLLQTAVYEELLPSERRRWHASIARALDVSDASDAVALGEVAEHWYLAGHPAEALKAAVEAGREAIAVVAPQQAWRHLSRAVDLWHRVRDPELVAGLGHADLLAQAAGAARWCALTATAVRLIREALDEPLAEPYQRAALEERLGRYCYEDGGLADASSAYQRAAEALRDAAPSALQAQIIAAQASLAMLTGHHQAAADAARRAADIAEAVGAAAQQAYALTTLGVSLSVLGREREALDALHRARDLGEAAGDVESILRSDVSSSVALDRLGRLEEAHAAARRGFDLAMRYQLTGSLGAVATANTVDLLRLLGRWSEADELSASVLRGPLAPVAGTFLMTVQAALYIARGRFDDASRRLSQAEELTDFAEPDSAVPFLAARTEFELWQSRPAAAWPHVKRALALLHGTDDAALISSVCALGMRTLADERFLARGQRRSAGHDVERLAKHLRSLIAEVTAGSVVSRQVAAWQATAEAEHGRLLAREDDRQWLLAAGLWQSTQRPYEEAYCRWRLAESALQVGRRDVAQLAGEQALRLARSLGARPLEAELTALAGRARLDLEGMAPQKKRESRSVELTARELDVLRLVATGLSNREVAKRLYVSDRTVGVHVSNILAKLHVSNRVEAATLAHRLGLVTSQPPR